jgi:hypothetical protein
MNQVFAKPIPILELGKILKEDKEIPKHLR